MWRARSSAVLAMWLSACASNATSDPSVADSGLGERDAASEQDADSEQDAAREQDASFARGCDLSGEWVEQHVTSNTALGMEQRSTNWSYHRIEQTGATVRIVESYDCGYVVRGSADVSLGDAALEAMAKIASHGAGTEGRFELNEAGDGCALEMARIYTLRGANKAEFIDAVWSIGDAPLPLSEFPLPASADDGMEDWDEDGHDGITQLTGFGDRYTAQIDWHAYKGTVPLGDVEGAASFGGEGVLEVEYDMRESVSEETTPILRTSSVPMSPGYGSMIRAAGLTDGVSGAHAELEICKKAQALAIETLGDPPRP